MILKDARGEINYFRIPIDENSYSTLTMGTEEFPVHLSYDNLTDYENCFVNWHKQKEVEISIVIDGALEVCLPGFSETYYTGDVFIIFPDVLHSIKKVKKEKCEYRTLLFNPSFLTGYPNSYWYRSFYKPIIESEIYTAGFRKRTHTTFIHELLPLLTYDTESLTAVQKMDLQHNLQNIWVKLFNSSYQPGMLHPKDQIVVNDMLSYLHQHYDECFSLNALSAQINMSRSECCRKFKKNMNMTLLEYLNEYRIGKAMELIEHSSLSMTEIASAAGFSSASKFSEIFRRKTQMTPRQYKKSLL